MESCKNGDRINVNTGGVYCFWYRDIIFAAYYILTLVPLYFADIVGHPLNKIWGIDKIIFGSAVGTIAFVLSYLLHNYLKKKNGNKSFFPYQKVVLPVTITIIVSIIFYLLILWRII